MGRVMDMVETHNSLVHRNFLAALVAAIRWFWRLVNSEKERTLALTEEELEDEGWHHR